MLNETERRSIEGLVLKYNRLSYEQAEMRCTNYLETKEELLSVTAQNSEKVQAINIENHIWYLNSIYNPTQAACDWAKQYDTPEINDYGIFIIFGMGDGRAISELLKVKPNCFLIVYEPSLAIFREAIKTETTADLLNNGRVFVVVEGICEEYFFHVLNQLITYSNYQLVVQAVLPNYDVIFADIYRRVLDIYRSIVELIVFTRNTNILRGIEMARNGYVLTADIIKQYSVGQLEGLAQKKGIEDIPAILVAAGPSLDKNIEDLKFAEGKAFLMVVDTALNTVLEHGITPDMTMSIDSRKPLELFRNEKTAVIPVALSSHSNKEVVERNRAQHFYEIDEEGYLNRIFSEVTGKEGKQLSTGGSVANNALSLLVETMGFRTIILVGQDLAYPGGREHTRLAYNSENDVVSLDRKEYIEVEDIYGNQVLTEHNMNLYRKWIENYIAGFSEIRVIDATEGGAKIVGTEVRTLRESLQELCKKKVKRNEFFGEIKPFFTEEEQEKLRAKIRQIPDELQELRLLIEEGNRLYEKLKGVDIGKEMKETMEVVNDIGELNKQIETMSISVEIRPYMEEESYAVEGQVFQYREDEPLAEQMRIFAELGLDLMKGYREGIQKFEKDFPLILEQFKK